jgi:hypothetical protein
VLRYPSRLPPTLPPSTLLAAHQSHRLFLDHRLAPAAPVQATLDPLAAIGALLLSAFAFGKTFEGPYLILALIVFSLTFPGTPTKGTSLSALAGDVASSWFVVVGLLLLIGWATRTLNSFDPRVILAWVFAGRCSSICRKQDAF